MGCVVALSTILPLMEEEVRLTSPECSTGLRRNCPLPSETMEAHALKSISKSSVCPAAAVNCPPAIWPDGILMPVCDSLESRRGCGVLGPLGHNPQFAVLPHWFALTEVR